MITPYTAQQPENDFGLRFSNLVYNASLAASTDTAVTMPGKAPRYVVKITAENDTWVAFNAVAAIPAGASFAVATSFLLPAKMSVGREVRAGDILHFFSVTAGTDVSIEFFGINSNN